MQKNKDSAYLSTEEATLQNNFRFFLEKSFQTLNPGTEFDPCWHIDLLCQKLQDVYEGKCKRLIINLPPRSLKSICVTAAWPAWVLGQDPTKRIMAASYSNSLSYKHSLDTKIIMESDWYKEAFPDVSMRKGQNTKAKFMTTENGFRMATSVQGNPIGEGGDFLIMDDPHNPAKMSSAKERKKAIDWFNNIFLSRLDNKKNGAIIVVMQRLHKDDLTASLLAAENHGWDHVSIPAIADKDYTYTSSEQSFTFKQGSILNESRNSLEILEQIQKQIGSDIFAAQYQQQPVSYENQLIKHEWVKYYKEPEGDKCNIVQSWDTSYSQKASSDYSVCTTWIETTNGHYLADLAKVQMDFPSLKDFVRDLARKWDPDEILIEDKASGTSLIQELSSEFHIQAMNPIGTKFDRLANASTLFKEGKVFIPEKANFTEDYLNELFEFPTGNHDDQVDSTSQYLNYVKYKLYRTSMPGMRRF